MRKKLSIVQTLKKTRQPKWDTNTLKTDTTFLSSYQEAIEQKLNVNDSNTLEEKWHKTKKAVLDAAKETIGERKQE